jgi:thiamine phosphate synthase YjbQ (UPF0047 family)
MNIDRSPNRLGRTVKHVLVTVGITAGVLAVTASQASAGIGVNHSEPTLRTR